MSLSFNTLRRANRRRLPLFRNRYGLPAHSKPDGSDWSPAQWLQALMGEVGEFAEQRILYEQGKITFQEYAANAAKELADIQGYLDLLSARALDTIAPVVERGPGESAAQGLMAAIAELGLYANSRKKFERGDLNDQEFHRLRGISMKRLADSLIRLTSASLSINREDPADRVIEADPHGVNLGAATEAKWNEISERIDCPLRIIHDGIYSVKP